MMTDPSSFGIVPGGRVSLEADRREASMRRMAAVASYPFMTGMEMSIKIQLFHNQFEPLQRWKPDLLPIVWRSALEHVHTLLTVECLMILEFLIISRIAGGRLTFFLRNAPNT